MGRMLLSKELKLVGEGANEEEAVGDEPAGLPGIVVNVGELLNGVGIVRACAGNGVSGTA